MARVLVIDDSDITIGVLREALELDGHEVQELTSFLDLPTVINRTPPDVIILDLNMPMMSGKQAGAFIRKYQRKHIPVIIHSSEPYSALLSARQEISAEGVLKKGSSMVELRRMVRNLASQGDLGASKTLLAS